tara:strand:+ start:900 stop:1094 length:195 start_codon:yes stop_codon:yes gene_type:complete
MNTNPLLKAYRGIKTESIQEPVNNKSKGLVSRNKPVNKNNSKNSKNELSDRMARYVNDIRNYND